MDKKAKKKKEREQKKKDARRQASRSPFEKLDPPPKDLRFLINEGWFDIKLADILVRRDLGGGQLAIGWFKVSLDVAGLQLAEGQLDAVELDWEEAVANYSASGKMVPCDAATVRMLVEGGARIAPENGLKLPERWDKWARIYGPPAESMAAADISKFDQGYYGTTSELRDRLVGYDVKAFVERTDIDMDPEDDLGLFPEWGRPPEIVLDGVPDPLDDETPEELLIRQGETPHPDLPIAQEIQIRAGFAAAPDLNNDIDLEPGDSPLWQASVAKQIAAYPEDRRAALLEALAQWGRYCDYLFADVTERARKRRGEATGNA